MRKINEEILLNYIYGKLSASEESEVDNWIKSSPENRKLLEQVFLTRQLSFDLQLIDSINCEEAFFRLKSAIDKKRKKKMLDRRLKIVMQGCAILFLPLIVFVGYLLLETEDKPREMADNLQPVIEVSSNQGSISSFFLPDSTFVWLNAGSKLTYPSGFNEKNRWVLLAGEALFKVRKSEIPLEIKVDSSYSINVLGTILNVQAYSEDKFIKTTLVEGQIKLTYLLDGNVECSSIMNPNESSLYSKNDGKIRFKSVDPEADIAWKDGHIIFDNHSLHDVLNLLSRYYNVAFNVADPEIYKTSMTGKFDNESLFQVLDYIKEASGIKYSIEKKSNTSDGLSKQKITLFK